MSTGTQERRNINLDTMVLLQLRGYLRLMLVYVYKLDMVTHFIVMSICSRSQRKSADERRERQKRLNEGER